MIHQAHLERCTYTSLMVSSPVCLFNESTHLLSSYWEPGVVLGDTAVNRQGAFGGDDILVRC